MVLRPNLLSIYRDRHEAKLRHQINLSELTAVARQKDPKHKEKHIFGLFSPSRNYHLEAPSYAEAQAWVELIRQSARMDEQEEEMYLASPGGASTAYQGFERSIDAQLSSSAAMAADYSSSDMEALSGTSYPRSRDWAATRPPGTANGSRLSTAEYSGVEHGSFSDFSDSAGLSTSAAARLSALSLTPNDGRPSTSSTRPPPSNAGSVYGATAVAPPVSSSTAPAPTRPTLGARNPSQLSGFAPDNPARAAPATNPPLATSIPPPLTLATTATAAIDDPERVIYQGSLQLLKSSRGVRRWQKVWMVLRQKGLALYKNEDEYAALLVLPVAALIDAVEVDPLSRSKTACMQVLSEERNFRFCAPDEEALARWLGAFKSLLARRKG